MTCPTPAALLRLASIALLLTCVSLLAGCASPPNSSSTTSRVESEVRGTWLTTTANDAISTPAKTAESMRRLREIGLNTVYVEVWKNGYTQYPSEVLRKVVGVDRRPTLVPQDPSDTPEQLKRPARDLLQETLIEAHRNGLIYMAWFEYGFMAAHKSTNPHLRRMKPEWMSRDINGNEVAPNGFVWMNPLHPEARRFLLDLVLEAVAHYDLDGIQLDDRIVWPYVTMGYDEYTKQVYRAEHQGREPPADHTDPAWMRWRADKVNEFAKWFVQEVRAKRPGLVISLSPAVYDWSWTYYLLEWPKWGAWSAADRVSHLPGQTAASKLVTPRWDEFIPQAYRFTYPAFEKTWREQTEWMASLGANRQADLIAGIRLVGDGRQDSTWEQLRNSMELTRSRGNGGHVHWFSRGVLDIFPTQLSDYYRGRGAAKSPHFPANWRVPSIPLFRAPPAATGGEARWMGMNLPRGQYQLIGFDGTRWEYAQDVTIDSSANDRVIFNVRDRYTQVELIRDRREDMRRERSAIAPAAVK